LLKLELERTPTNLYL